METAKAFTSLELNVLKGAFSVPNYCPLSSQQQDFFMAILDKMDIFLQWIWAVTITQGLAWGIWPFHVQRWCYLCHKNLQQCVPLTVWGLTLCLLYFHTSFSILRTHYGYRLYSVFHFQTTNWRSTHSTQLMDYIYISDLWIYHISYFI